MTGRVVSVKMKNTIVVLVEYTKTHPLYKKTYLQSKKFLVDDQLGVSLGDIVKIVSTKPISKRKHFKVEKIIGRDIEQIVGEELQQQVAKVIEEVMPVEKDDERLDKNIQKDDQAQTEPAKVLTKKGTSKKSK